MNVISGVTHQVSRREVLPRPRSFRTLLFAIKPDSRILRRNPALLAASPNEYCDATGQRKYRRGLGYGSNVVQPHLTGHRRTTWRRRSNLVTEHDLGNVGDCC